jgi:hypothetical protein
MTAVNVRRLALELRVAGLAALTPAIAAPAVGVLLLVPLDALGRRAAYVIVIDHRGVLFQGTASTLTVMAHGAVWLLTRPAGHPAPGHPVGAVTPAGSMTCSRAISAEPPEPGAQPAESTVEDGYIPLMRASTSIRHAPERNR